MAGDAGDHLVVDAGGGEAGDGGVAQVLEVELGELGRVLRLLGPRLALGASMSFAALAFVCLGFLRPDSGMVVIVIGLALFGIGRGLMFGIASPVAMGAVPESKSAAASGLFFFSINIALPLGVAITSALFRAWENIHLGDLFALAGGRISAEMQAEIYGLLSGSEAARAEIRALATDLAERVDFVINHAFTHGLHSVLFVNLAVCVAGLLTPYLIRRRYLGDPPTSGEGHLRFHD